MITILFIFSYLIGSIPFGLIISKITKIGDIRTMGSGNIGATNVYRVAGKKLGIITFLLDFSKCLIIPIITKIYFIETTQQLILWYAFFATIGHMFPFYIKFKGGKGVACLFATSFVSHILIGVFLSIMWITIFKIFRYSSLSSLLSTAMFLILHITIHSNFEILPVFIIALLIFIKHKENIKRLITGNENKI